VLAKPTAYFLIPLLLVAAPGVLRRRIQVRAALRGWPALGVLGLFGVAAFAAWRYILPAVARRLDLDAGGPGSAYNLLAILTTQDHYSLLNAVWGAFKSYWLNFGWMSLPLPDPAYSPLLALMAAALVGAALRAQLRPPNTSLYPLLGLSAGLPVAILYVSFVLSPDGVFIFQGRYVFGGITAQALLLAAGWLSLFPRRYAGWGLWALTTGLLFLDVVGLGWVVIPFYYQ